MAAKRTVIIGAPADGDRPTTLRDVTVRELAVQEVRDWLVEYEASQAGQLHTDPILAMVWPDFGLEDLARMCDAPAAALAAYPPSELETLVVACKEINPHFFRPRAAVAQVARAIQAEAARMQSTATAAH